MKNVHLITKEQEGADVLHQYHYITSEEEIKEGDWYLNLTLDYIQKSTDRNYLKGEFEGYKKIILTDNPDLIADGVQPIDNEFLELFVKNPSCEFVKVILQHQYQTSKEYYINAGYVDCTKEQYDLIKSEIPTCPLRIVYQIIIPQEEPKQIKCYCGHTITCDCEPLQETLEEPTEEAKQRAENYMSLKGALEPLQETLEEAKLKFCNDSNNWQGSSREDLKLGWDACAKWQAERMYSEEDMISFAKYLLSKKVTKAKSISDLEEYLPKEFQLLSGELMRNGKELISEWLEQYYNETYKTKKP